MPADRSSKIETKTESAPSEQLLLNEGDISLQNREALLQIASMIRLAESFRLGFVKCNQPVQCLQMLERLKKMLVGEADIIIVNLKEPVSSLRRAVLQALDSDSLAQKKKAIMILGFERSIPSEGPAPVLDELNQSRDNFPKSFSGPFLIWLPDYALTLLAREAPDFWGWRSGVFEFSPEQKMMDLVERTMLQGAEEDRLSLEGKIEHASALEGLIADYQEMDRGERENRALSEILHRLGKIRNLLGDYAAAKKLHQQSLEIFQQLGDQRGMSRSLHQLGNLAYFTGDYDEARKLYQQSLEIDQKLGDKSHLSMLLHNLGNLADAAGNYAEARKLYTRSLEIAQELGDKRAISRSLHNLGNLAYGIGDYNEARKLYQQSLEIDQELDNKSDESIALISLGNMAIDAGNYAEARKLYKESLEIAKEFGDQIAMSMSLINLGRMARENGNYAEARKLYQQSLEIAKKLGDKNVMLKSLLDLGILAQDADDCEAARKLYRQSLEIGRQLGEKERLASILGQYSRLEEKEGHLDKALELIKEAEALFLELKSPIASLARRDRERLERKQHQSWKISDSSEIKH